MSAVENNTLRKTPQGRRKATDVAMNQGSTDALIEYVLDTFRYLKLASWVVVFDKACSTFARTSFLVKAVKLIPTWTSGIGVQLTNGSRFKLTTT